MYFKLFWNNRKLVVRFYFQHEIIDFNAGIANDEDFKSYKYKAKLLGNTAADGVNGNLRNATIAVWFKYLSNF